jgi:uncharacterized membrane protein YuzA (DUF378 family)
VLLSSLFLFGAKVAAAPTLASAVTPNSATRYVALIGQNSVNAACQGISLSGNPCSTKSGNSIDNLLGTIISILSIVVGIIAVIMIIVGGLKFITSGGEASKTASARSTIIYAIIGIAVAVLAQLLVHFVLNKSNTAINKSAFITAPTLSPEITPTAIA